MSIVVKEEPVISMSDLSGGTAANNANNGNNVEIGRKIEFKKIFQNRKKSSERTRAKKLRLNRQLRKAMLPKNALMALIEIKGIKMSDFIINSDPDGIFTATVTVNAEQYEGKGLSKTAAKNKACEKALRDYIISKMENESQQAEFDESTPEDDVPMLNLASFAIYKLFAEWRREGIIVPEMHSNAANVSAPQTNPSSPTAATTPIPKEPKKPRVRTELPPDWKTMHPATLLCIMRPELTFIQVGTVGEKLNGMQCLAVYVDNQYYVANGRSKKIARRNLAMNVCNILFHTNFTCEEY